MYIINQSSWLTNSAIVYVWTQMREGGLSQWAQLCSDLIKQCIQYDPRWDFGQNSKLVIPPAHGQFFKKYCRKRLCFTYEYYCLKYCTGGPEPSYSLCLYCVCISGDCQLMKDGFFWLIASLGIYSILRNTLENETAEKRATWGEPQVFPI